MKYMYIGYPKATIIANGMYRTRTVVSSAQNQELNSVERLEECFFVSKAERSVRP